MNMHSARQVLLVAQECSRRLDESLELAAGGCSTEEYEAYGRMVAKMMALLFENVMAPVYYEHPGLAPDWYNEMNERRSGSM